MTSEARPCIGPRFPRRWRGGRRKKFLTLHRPHTWYRPPKPWLCTHTCGSHTRRGPVCTLFGEKSHVSEYALIICMMYVHVFYFHQHQGQHVRHKLWIITSGSARKTSILDYCKISIILYLIFIFWTPVFTSPIFWIRETIFLCRVAPEHSSLNKDRKILESFSANMCIVDSREQNFPRATFQAQDSGQKNQI